MMYRKQFYDRIKNLTWDTVIDQGPDMVSHLIKHRLGDI